MKIYITGDKESFDLEQIQNIEKLGEVIYLTMEDVKNPNCFANDSEKILALDPDYFDWNLSNEYLDNISNIKAICVNSTSYSWLDVNHCKDKGIIVTNVPKYSSSSVAEYATFMMLALARKYPLQYKNNFKCEYNDEMLMSNLDKKIVGVIGLGSIGNKIADICKGFNMNIKYWDRTDKNNGYELTTLEDLFKTCDFIFPALVSNEETRKLITDDHLNSMKNDASLISIVHGDLYNHKLLLEKVKNKEIYGYAFEENNFDMKDCSGNVFVTSAYAWYTKESLENLKKIWLDSILSILDDNVINEVLC